MKKNRLGRTDIQVSEIGLGTMTFGEQNSEADAHAQLDMAVDYGVNLIDTAELYAVPPRAETQGLTETYIGNWLKRRGGRDRVVIATKVAGPADWAAHIRGGPRLNAQHIEAAVEGSLRRLQTDYIDLYQVHWPERPTNFFGELGWRADAPARVESPIAIEETLAALDRLVRTGKVRAVGVSNETPWGVHEYLRLSDTNGWTRIASIQNPYSLLNRSFEVGLAEMAVAEDVPLLAYSPLAFGVLTGKYLQHQRPEGARLTRFPHYTRYSSPQALAASECYVQLAHQAGLPPAQMALAFVRQQPFVASTLIGATTLAQLRENLDSTQVTLDSTLLESIALIHRNYPYPAP